MAAEPIERQHHELFDAWVLVSKLQGHLNRFTMTLLELTPLPTLQVRVREGTDCADGIDTLILHLLALLSPARVADLEAFAAQPNSTVAGSQLRQLLQQRQLFQVLALVQGRAGKVEAALQTWQVGCRLMALPGCLMGPAPAQLP